MFTASVQPRPRLTGASAAIAALALAGCATANAGVSTATCNATPDANARNVIVSARSGFGYVSSGEAKANLRGPYVLAVQCTGSGKLGFSVQVDNKPPTTLVFQCDGNVQTQPVLQTYSGEHTVTLNPLRAMPQDTVGVIRPVTC